MKPFFVLIFILIPLVNASILTVNNTDPQPFESVIGTISSAGGIDSTLTKSDLKFYKDEIQKTPQEYEIYFYEGSYYFYFIFTTEGNYTLKIDKILYKTSSGLINSEDINLNFQVKENNETPNLQIRPGVFYGYDNFNLNLVNKGDSTLNVKIDEEEYEIKDADSVKIFIEDFTGLKFVNIESYKSFSVPLISLSKPRDIADKNNITEEPDLEINNGSQLEYVVKFNKREDISLSIKSLIQEDITITEIISDIQGVSVLNYPEGLTNNSEETLDIKIKLEELGLSKGNILINYSIKDEEKILLVPIKIYVSEEEIEIQENNDTEENKTCAELGITTFCDLSKNTCSGHIKFCEDDKIACIGGDCVEIDLNQNPTEEKGKGWIIILIVIIVIALLAYGIFSKYKKVK